MRTQRIFTNDEAAGMIEAALVVTETVNPPDDLRAVAFQAALNIVCQREQIPVGGGLALPHLQS